MKHSAFNRIAVVVLMTTLMGAGFQLLGWAQVGPPDPSSRPQPPQEQGSLNTLADSLKKLLKKDGAEKTAPAKAAEPAQTDAKKGVIWMHAPEATVPSPASPTPAASPQQPASAQEPTAPQAPSRPPLLTPTRADTEIAPPQVSEDSPPPKLIHIDNPQNPLGIADARNKLSSCGKLVTGSQWDQAQQCLSPLRQWLIDSTEGHISLYKALNEIPSARTQAELEKQLGLQFAVLRDEAIFQMGKVYVSKKEYQKAMKELVEVVKSQPRSEIGHQSYEMLQKIGFTEKLQLAE